MPVCRKIRQSIDVNVPVDSANEEWTQFVSWNIYHRPLGLPDETEAEPNAGGVSLEALDRQTTHVTIDLVYCPHFEGISAPEETHRVEEHLRQTLARYKSFVESRSWMQAPLARRPVIFRT